METNEHTTNWSIERNLYSSGDWASLGRKWKVNQQRKKWKLRFIQSCLQDQNIAWKKLVLYKNHKYVNQGGIGEGIEN